jgi:hypothetical protein
LLAHGAEDLAGIGMETAVVIGVSDVANSFAREADKIETSVARNLTGEHNEIALGQRFARDPAMRILLEAGVQDAIANGVADFIGMTFRDGLRRKDVAGHGDEADL